MNSITFDGRVVADAELRYTQSGDPVLSFRVASDIGYGERKSTNWFQCQIWGKRAEAIKDYLPKGQQVTIYGALMLREWEDKEGIKRLSPDVRVNDLSLQGGKRDDGQQGQQRQGNGTNDYAREKGREPAPPRRQESKPAPRMDDLDSDIPFN